MVTGRARRSGSSPRPGKKNGSSQHPMADPGAEESRFFGAHTPGGPTVRGSVPGWSLPKAALAALLRGYLKALGVPNASLDLQLVGDDDSRRLNRRYRDVDSATDVLSFPSEPKVATGFKGHLGEIVLDLPYAWRKRGRFHPRFEGEAAFLLLHGLLHLLGQHHTTPAQERALEARQALYFPPSPALLAGLKALRPKA